jgi:hypothetical protein
MDTTSFTGVACGSSSVLRRFNFPARYAGHSAAIHALISRELQRFYTGHEWRLRFDHNPMLLGKTAKKTESFDRLLMPGIFAFSS